MNFCTVLPVLVILHTIAVVVFCTRCGHRVPDLHGYYAAPFKNLRRAKRRPKPKHADSDVDAVPAGGTPKTDHRRMYRQRFGLQIRNLETSFRTSCVMVLLAVPIAVFYAALPSYTSCMDPIMLETVTFVKLSQVSEQWAWSIFQCATLALSAVFRLQCHRSAHCAAIDADMLRSGLSQISEACFPCKRALSQWKFNSGAARHSLSSRCARAWLCRILYIPLYLLAASPSAAYVIVNDVCLAPSGAALLGSE